MSTTRTTPTSSGHVTACLAFTRDYLLVVREGAHGGSLEALALRDGVYVAHQAAGLLPQPW